MRLSAARTEAAFPRATVSDMNHPSPLAIPPEHPPSTYQDEISLLELWDIVVRRKLWIVATPLISVAAAFVYLFVATPVYEASVKLRIGQVADLGELEDPDVLSAWLVGKYGEEIATGVKRDPPFLAKAAVQKGSKTVVDLVVRGISPEQSADLLRRIAEQVIERHGETYKSQVDLAYRRIDQIDTQRRLLTELFAASADLLNTLKQRDPVQASLLTLERGRLATELSVAERELPAWQQKLNAPKTVMTEMLGDVAVPAKPASPKKPLTVAFAAVLGVMGGVMLAFVAEFLARSKNQRGGAVVP